MSYQCCGKLPGTIHVSRLGYIFYVESQEEKVCTLALMLILPMASLYQCRDHHFKDLVLSFFTFHREC